MPAIDWANAALAELAATEAYLDDFDPVIARDTVDAIIAATERREAFPRSGPFMPDDRRSLGVAIARVRHARENWRA